MSDVTRVVLSYILKTHNLAGHETTAHSLCYSLGLLALYQDEQERSYKEIKKAIPENRDPVCLHLR